MGSGRFFPNFPKDLWSSRTRTLMSGTSVGRHRGRSRHVQLPTSPSGVADPSRVDSDRSGRASRGKAAPWDGSGGALLASPTRWPCRLPRPRSAALAALAARAARTHSKLHMRAPSGPTTQAKRGGARDVLHVAFSPAKCAIWLQGPLPGVVCRVRGAGRGGGLGGCKTSRWDSWGRADNGIKECSVSYR